MKRELIDNISIESSATILQALKKMDEQKRKLLIVVDNGSFRSLLSIGDIQRAVIANTSMNQCVRSILRTNIRVASVGDDKEMIKSHMRENRNDFMPILDGNNNVVDIIFWDELFDSPIKNESQFDLPVIIMAGGQGSRLRPLTNVLPKPLIPIGQQTMLEDIMDRFVACGSTNFYLSVNYKADVIKRYFDTLSNRPYNLSYFQENKPLGTAGSLHLLKEKINTTFFVSNCDIIIDEDYGRILQYHAENKNEITVVAAIKTMALPYGTLETKENGLLASLLEKPSYTFKINTGLYILEPHLINEIPEDEFYHITFLIEKLISEGRRVGVYPINEGSWIDIGNWDEYMKYIKQNYK